MRFSPPPQAATQRCWSLAWRVRAGGVVCWLVAVSTVLAAGGTSRVQAGIEGSLQLELVEPVADEDERAGTLLVRGRVRGRGRGRVKVRVRVRVSGQREG